LKWPKIGKLNIGTLIIPQGLSINEKNQSSKISCYCPFKMPKEYICWAETLLCKFLCNFFVIKTLHILQKFIFSHCYQPCCDVLSMFVLSKWHHVLLPTHWHASVRLLFYCNHTFLDHTTNISRKVHAPRRISLSGAQTNVQNCHLDKTNMDKS